MDIKKVFLFAILIFVTLFSTSYSLEYEEQARGLYDLGLYLGRSQTTYEPDLEGKVTRQDASIMLLRIFGLEDEALKLNLEEARNILKSDFLDAKDVADYAVRQVAYATNEGIIMGFPDGRFGPRELITGKQYCALVLRMLGYTDELDELGFANAGKLFSMIAYISSERQKDFDVDDFIKREILVGISFSALKSNLKNSDNLLAERLIEEGIVDRQQMEEKVLNIEVDELRVLEIYPVF